MKKTSYDKIYALLLETKECQALLADAQKSILNLKLQKVTFRLGGHPYEAIPQFHLSCDATWDREPGELSPRSFIERDAVAGVIRDCFGPEKQVKTRNCNRSIVFDGGTVQTKVDGYRETRDQGSFYNWLCKFLDEKFADDINEAQRRAAKEINDLQLTEAYAKSRHEALVAYCKDTITKALLPWNHMPERVLNDAWKQFVCAAAMVE